MREPFAGVAFGDFRLRRQFRWRHWTLLLERLVQAELVAHAHHGHAECAAEIAKYFADERVQLGLVHHFRLLERLDDKTRLPNSQVQSNGRF